MYIDTHAHILPGFYTDPDGIIEKAKAQNITKIVNIGTTINECIDVLSLKEKYPEVLFPSLGLHPDIAKDATEKELDKQFLAFERLVAKNKQHICSIGEAGFDFKGVTFEDRKRIQKKQQLLFGRQLNLCAEHGLPIIIHCRDGYDELLDALSAYTGSGVLHSADGKQEHIETLIRQGFYISFNGILTFKNASAINELALNISLEHILLETDSPFLTPVPYRGQRNDPSYIPVIYQYMASLKKIPLEVVQGTVLENAQRLFKNKL